MTSLTRMEKGKPSGVGRCLLATDDLPLRRRRIQILFPRVAAISSPKAGDVGPAAPHDTGRRATLINPGCFRPLAGAPGGRVERVGSATASFFHLCRRPAKNAAQHIAKSFCPVAPSVFGSAHVHQHEGSHAHEVVKACRGFGNVCRT